MKIKFKNKTSNLSSSPGVTDFLSQVFNKMSSRKIEKQVLVHPCLIGDQPTLVYEKGLSEKDRKAFRYVEEFALRNGYQLKEDQRADFIEGIKRVKDAKQATVMTIMVLSASLFAQNAFAKDHSEKIFANGANLNDTTHSEVIEGYSFNIADYHSEDELISGLIGWINDHSSFDYKVDDLPTIKKVSSRQIAKTAYGGKLPKAVNPDTLKIYGLYNFNEKAVYILDSLDLESTEGVGILLHELVHFLQYQHGHDEKVKCKNELESLAYILEAQFLKAHKHANSISMAHVDKLSQCRS